MILTNLKAVILDMDGTLIDSMGIWQEIDKQFFAEYHLIPPENLSNQVSKMSMQEWAEYFIKNFHIPLTESQIIQKIEKMAFDYYNKIIPMKPYVLEFLDFLDAHNLPYGIATASYRSSAYAVLSRLGIKDRMQFIMTAENLKNSAMFHNASAFLHSTPEQTLIVEDSLHYIQIGKTYNFKTAVVYDKFTPSDDWETAKQISDIYGNNLQEIMLKLQNYL